MGYGIRMLGADNEGNIITNNSLFNYQADAFEITSSTTEAIIRDNYTRDSDAPNIASSTTITLPAQTSTVNITGANTIDTINGYSNGRIATLTFTNTATITNTGNVSVVNNFTAYIGGTLTIAWANGKWVEVGRSHATS